MTEWLDNMARGFQLPATVGHVWLALGIIMSTLTDGWLSGFWWLWAAFSVLLMRWSGRD